MFHALSGLAALAAAAGAGHPVCAWRPGEVLETSGEVRTGGLTGRLERRTEAGTGRLSETDDLGIVVTRNGYDGRLAWSQDMSGGVHDLNSGFARRLAASQAWLDARPGCPPSARERMVRLGTRREHGRGFAAWRASPPGGVPFELWYDLRTGRLDRAFFQTSETRLIRHFADWRDLGGGRWVAFELRDELPEDEDEVVRRIAHADVKRAAALGDFERPRPPSDVILPARSTTVRFDDDHRTRIYLPVYLNGKGPFAFELDNGGHNILTTETAQALGLTGAGSFSSTGAGNDVARSGIVRLKQIRIGDAVLTDQPVQVRKLGANDRSPDPPRAGILGLELFERLVVAIDPGARTVTLSRFGAVASPAAGTPVPLLFTEDAPLVAGSYRGRHGDFMLDTGNAGATIIEDYWARPLGLTVALSRGVARGDAKISRGPVGLGPFDLGDELVSYYGPAARGSEYTRAVAGIFGQPLLSRFRSTYDYSRGTVWLEQLPDVAPFAFDRSGVSLAKLESGAFKVSAVTPGGPADAAGIRTDDRITTIDGTPSKVLSRADAGEMFRRPAGTEITVAGTFSGVAGSKAFELRELLPAPRFRRP